MNERNRGALVPMPHHAVTTCRRRRIALITPLLAASVLALLACSDDDGGTDEEPVTTTLSIVATAGAPISGLQLDLRHGSALTVTSVTDAAAFSLCQDNVTTGRVQSACVVDGTVATPLTAWTLAVLHAPDVEPFDQVTSLTCSAVGADSQPVAVTCVLD